MSKSARGLHLEPSPSATLHAILITAHAAALTAISFCPWPIEVKSACLAAILAGALMSRKRVLREAEVKSLHLMADGSWHLLLFNGRECKGELSGESLVTTWFCLPVFSTAGGRRRILIFRDSLDQERYRKLRLSLRVSPGPFSPGAPGEGGH